MPDDPQPERQAFADKLLSRAFFAFLLPFLPTLLDVQGSRLIFFAVLAAYSVATGIVIYGVRSVLEGALEGTALGARRFAKHLIIAGAVCQTLIGACLLYGYWNRVYGDGEPSGLGVGLLVLIVLIVPYALIGGWAAYVIQGARWRRERGL